jgi:hypothetical protein
MPPLVDEFSCDVVPILIVVELIIVSPYFLYRDGIVKMMSTNKDGVSCAIDS